jgi:hypothetical protein
MSWCVGGSSCAHVPAHGRGGATVEGPVFTIVPNSRALQASAADIGRRTAARLQPAGMGKSRPGYPVSDGLGLAVHGSAVRGGPRPPTAEERSAWAQRQIALRDVTGGRKPSVPLGSADRLAVHESAVRSYDANLLRYGSPAIRSAPPQSKRAWLRAQLAKRKEYLEAIRALLDGGGATLLPGRAAAYGRIEEESLDDMLAKLDA